MSGLINELITILSAQATFYEQLCALSKEKTDTIISNDIEGLQRITNVEAIIISKNQKLEKSRIIINKDIATVLGKDEKELTLSVLLEVIKNQAEYMELKEAHEKILKILEDLRVLNAQNRKLINSSLEYIEFTMNAIRSTVTNEPSLFSSKGEELENNKGFFDAKQ